MLVGPSGTECLAVVWIVHRVGMGRRKGQGFGRLMVYGEAEINTRGFDPRRYGNFATERFIVERTKTNSARRHDTPGPGKHQPASAEPASVV